MQSFIKTFVFKSLLEKAIQAEERAYRYYEPEDLYVRMVNFYHDFMGGVPEYTSFDNLISRQ